MSKNSSTNDFAKKGNEEFQYINLDIESGEQSNSDKQDDYEQKLKLALAQAAAEQQALKNPQKLAENQHHAGCEHTYLKNQGGDHNQKDEHGHKKNGTSSSHNRNQIFQEHAWQIRLFTTGMPLQGYIITMFVSISNNFDSLI